MSDALSAGGRFTQLIKDVRVFLPPDRPGDLGRCDQVISVAFELGPAGLATHR